MKKQTLMIVATVSFLIALSTVSAFAQIVNRVDAKIPFEFSVSNQTLPAGNYTLGKMMSTSSVLVRNKDQKVALASIAIVTTGNKEAAATQLIFHRYGNQYFLARIEMEGRENGLTLPKTKAERVAAQKASERHLANSGGAPEIVTVPASL